MMHKQKGNLIAISVILIAGLSAFAITGLQLLNTATESSNEFLKSHQSAYIARGGMEDALLQIKNNIDKDNPTDYCDGNWKTTETLGTGEYRFKCDVYSPSGITTVGVTTPSVVIIKVSDLTDLAPIGRVTIDSEQIDYSDTSSDQSVCGGSNPNVNCLLVKKRGANDTVITSHPNGSDVTQTNQIVVTVEGAVPSITNPEAEKEIKQAITAGSAEAISGFAVGDSGAIYKRFSDNRWNTATTTPATTANFNDVTCVSATDCWAVGGSNTATIAYRWDGTSWTQFTSTNLTGNLLSVTCQATDNCWISNNNAQVFHWTGGSDWTQDTSYTGGQDINKISCPDATTCFGVGNAGVAWRWDSGVGWSAMTSNTTKDLMSVSCTSTSFCVAVGDKTTGKGAAGTIRYYTGGGSWNTASTNPISGNLVSVSCTSNTSTFCWAITIAEADTATSTDGDSWTTQTIGGTTSILNSIYCPTNTQCYAVGDRASTSTPTIVSWDGTSWTADTVTVTGTARNLNAITTFTPVDTGGSTDLGVVPIVWRDIYN